MPQGRIDRFVCWVTTKATSIPAMGLTFAGMTYWFIASADWLGRVDAILSGGATLFAQMIYREGAPRDEAMHRKLDEIIHGTDADDGAAGIERD